MEKNPYAKFLQGSDAKALIQAFPSRLTDVVGRLGEAGMGLRYAPGKWTVSEVLCHLADCEIAFSFRWRQTLAEDGYVAQAFDQDRWSPRYPVTSGQAALRTFLALRAWNSILLEQLNAADWERTLTHPERGEFSFRTLVELTAGHDLNHLAQLETLASAKIAG
jgi:hypothetical protein